MSQQCIAVHSPHCGVRIHIEIVECGADDCGRMVFRAWLLFVCVFTLSFSGPHAVFRECMHYDLYTIECSSVRPDAALCITCTRTHAFTCTHICTRMFTPHTHVYTHTCMYMCVCSNQVFRTLRPPLPLWDLTTLRSVWFKWCSTFFLGCSPHLTG